MSSPTTPTEEKRGRCSVRWPLLSHFILAYGALKVKFTIKKERKKGKRGNGKERRDKRKGREDLDFSIALL